MRVEAIHTDTLRVEGACRAQDLKSAQHQTLAEQVKGPRPHPHPHPDAHPSPVTLTLAEQVVSLTTDHGPRTICICCSSPLTTATTTLPPIADHSTLAEQEEEAA